jgi:hypothetical protein
VLVLGGWPEQAAGPAAKWLCCTAKCLLARQPTVLSPIGAACRCSRRRRRSPVGQLRPAEWNANRVSAQTLKKIRASIEEFGFVENLVARPYPGEEGAFEVISGNHRLELVREMGFKDVPVIVVELDDAHARVLAQTLNRTRGRDDPLAYRKLINDVLSGMPVEEATRFLPESKQSLESILGSLEAPNIDVPEVWGVIVECKDETDQLEVLEKLTSEGRDCRALMA